MPGWSSRRCSRLRGRCRRQPAGGAARLAGAAATRASTSRRGTGSRAATWPTRRCASARRAPPIWTVATSDASNGSVNGGFDAQTPAGGAVPLVNLFLGEVIFGGVGSGLYGMFFYILIAVFVAGLMVGRTPEWLGKKIEAREIKIAALGALFVPTMVLTLTAISIVDALRASRRSTTPASTASPRPSTPTTPSRTTTAARSPASAPTSFSAEVGTIALLPRPFRPADRRARARRLAGPEEDRSRLRRHVPDRRADVRRPARRRDRADGRPDDLPRADARADRRRVDALMRAVVRSLVAIVVWRPSLFGFAYPIVMTGFAQVAFKNKANGSLITPERQGRRLPAGRAGLHGAEVLPSAPVCDGACLQRRRDDVREPRADEPRSRQERQGGGCGDPEARGALQPRAARSATSRSTPSRPRPRDRPRHLARECRAAVAAHRSGPPPAARRPCRS